MIYVVAWSFCTCLDGSCLDDFALRTPARGACPFSELSVDESSLVSTLDLELEESFSSMPLPRSLL